MLQFRGASHSNGLMYDY